MAAMTLLDGVLTTACNWRRELELHVLAARPALLRASIVVEITVLAVMLAGLVVAGQAVLRGAPQPERSEQNSWIGHQIEKLENRQDEMDERLRNRTERLSVAEQELRQNRIDHEVLARQRLDPRLIVVEGELKFIIQLLWIVLAGLTTLLANDLRGFFKRDSG